MRLYKDRYLLAKYDLQDRLIAVGTTPEEIGLGRNSDIYLMLKRQGSTYKNKQYTLHAIDCLEQHDDIFAEEDEEFLRFFELEREIER